MYVKSTFRRDICHMGTIVFVGKYISYQDTIIQLYTYNEVHKKENKKYDP